jgi:hypothetical protein
MNWADLGIYLGGVGSFVTTFLAFVNWTLPQFVSWTAIVVFGLYVAGAMLIVIGLVCRQQPNPIVPLDYEAVAIDIDLI